MNSELKWICTNLPSDNDGRLYFFEPGCSHGGFKTDDGETWYRISCSYWFGDWIEENGGDERWYAHGSPHRAIYVVREDLFTFIHLKWL